jgi:phospholipid transport system transporter-binding protein
MSSLKPDPNQAGRYLLSGELTFTTVPAVYEQGHAMFTTPTTTLTLRFINGAARTDSAGLALLVEWLREAREHGKTLRFENIPAQLKDLARVSGLERVLPLEG